MRAIEEFYVGYLPQAPPRLGRRLRALSIALCLGASALGSALAAAHRPLAVARFEFGRQRTFEGRLLTEPVPLLLVERPGSAPDGSPAAALSRYLLVGPGKHGAAPLVAELAGRRVRLSGTLVYRDGRTMVELVPGSLQALEGAPAAPSEPLSGGQRVTLRGEIVDSKCFLGVMNPGERKPHRACAARCIAGGIPPILHALVDGPDGPRARDVLLVGPAGESLARAVLPFVAEPVAVTGRLAELGELQVLYAAASDIERLP